MLPTVSLPKFTKLTKKKRKEKVKKIGGRENQATQAGQASDLVLDTAQDQACGNLMYLTISLYLPIDHISKGLKRRKNNPNTSLKVVFLPVSRIKLKNYQILLTKKLMTTFFLLKIYSKGRIASNH